ncbi:MAG: 3-oxoacyl-acyl-carrier-protein synthase III [Elusimicrobia bacterium]|nr:MAG: 3-oxoacyl-acyl-carrier-protein synthase III [Elusimicrobiota bacterium]
MRYSKVYLEALTYELAPVVVSSLELESRLEKTYKALHLQPGQLEAFTGIRERRWWEPGFKLSDGAARAGRKALEQSGLKAADIGALVYGGVCREQFEPATACAVAEQLGVGGGAAVYDVSNACLGVLSGIVDVANRIELGHIRAGLVVSCETAREINDATIERMSQDAGLESFKDSLATLTGGSGAVAALLTDGTFGPKRRRLVGGATRAAPEHHRICRWGLEPVTGLEPLPLHNGYRDRKPVEQVMRTDAVAVLKNGVALGKLCWADFLKNLSWTAESVDKVVCHQVGRAHQSEILGAFGVAPEKDFTTFEFLGNIGTVSLPLTAALAEEREALVAGDHVGWLGIGSGLNCLMLGWEW